jgi:hypothetical protein
MSVSVMPTRKSEWKGIPKGNWNTGMFNEDMPGNLLESHRVQRIHSVTLLLHYPKEVTVIKATERNLIHIVPNPIN